MVEKTYSIKDLALLSGIKAHTIRIWEQRYDLLHPVRTATNIRRYSDDDLRLIMNISILNKNGLKISKLVNYTNDELGDMVLEIMETNKDIDTHLDGFKNAMFGLDEAAFNRLFMNVVNQFGFERAIVEVIYPLLSVIGNLWLSGTISPLHEHFITALIRQKIIVAIDLLPVPEIDIKNGFVLACPEEEQHELGLMFANYLLRNRGYHTIYLGATVPTKDLGEIVKDSGVRNIYLNMVVNIRKMDLSTYILGLTNSFSEEVKLYISGKQVVEFPHKALFPNVTFLTGLEEFSQRVFKISA